jgi:hypothetical protein
MISSPHPDEGVQTKKTMILNLMIAHEKFTLNDNEIPHEGR